MTTSNILRSNLENKTTACPSWKRALDITVSLLALTFLSPIILLIVVGIKVVSGGPILFRQKRIGYKGNSFLLLKFRSMKVNADTSLHQDHSTSFIKEGTPMTKLDKKGDSRLIAGAWLLRASGFDELPQLINVLRGDMSIVGPRPCTNSEFAEYTEEQKARFNAIPGLTGLWQVSGKNKTTFPEMIRLDTQYCAEKTLWMDLKIMLKTPLVLISQIVEARTSETSSQAASQLVVG